MNEHCTFYARCSTDTEEQENSIKNQISGLSRYAAEKQYLMSESGVFCKRDGSQVLYKGYIDEGFSGAKSAKHRKAFQQMLKDAKLGYFDIILTKSVSRFGRNVKEMLIVIDDLKKIDVGVWFEDIQAFSLNQTDMLKIQLFATLAEEESRSKSDSVQWAKKEAARKGIWSGREPYGYNMQRGKLIVNQFEAQIVNRIFEMYLNKSYGVNKIAKVLETEEVATKRGGRWTGSHVAKILSNEIYIGNVRLHRTRKENINLDKVIKVPLENQIHLKDETLRIIKNDIFERVAQEKFSRPHIGNYVYKTVNEANEEGIITEKKVRIKAEAIKDNRHSSAHLFSNLLTCMNCNGGLRKKVQKTKRTTHHYYYCRNHELYGEKVCSYRNLQKEEELLEWVKEEFVKFISNKEGHEFDFKMLMESKYGLEDFEEKAEQINQKILELEHNKDSIFELYIKKRISDEDFSNRYDPLNSEIEQLKAQQRRFSFIDVEIEATRLQFEEFINELKTVDLDNLNNTTLRKFMFNIQVGMVWLPDEKNNGAMKEQAIKAIRWKFMGNDIMDIYGEHVRKYVFDGVQPILPESFD